MHTLTIVGVGLIGGSIGLAAKKRGLARRVLGVGRNQEQLDRVRQLGVIDETCLDPPAAAAASDIIVVCTPVDRIAEQVLAMIPHCRPGTLITDAGSTKGVIVQAVEEKLPDAGQRLPFVGSHPLAGSEKQQGAQHADADLFQNRWTIVTRSPRTDVSAMDQIMTFWQQLGSRVRVMDPVAHDQALALTSHLPHLLAASLAGILPRHLNELTATGFRDMTRIAAGDPQLWEAIFAQNSPALLEAMKVLGERLEEFRLALGRSDGKTVVELLMQGKKVRDGLESR